MDGLSNRIREHLESMCEPGEAIEVLNIHDYGDALMVDFTFNDGEELQTAVYYPTGDCLMTPVDWQSGRPEDPSEFEDYLWMSSAGDEAIIIDGWPRSMLLLRDEARKEFGRKIARLRMEKGWSQGELAERSGLKRPNINAIEAGRYSVTLTTITRLGAALGEELI